jgi:hypothetical protein
MSSTFYLTIIVLTFVSPLIVPVGVTVHHAVTEAIRSWQMRGASATPALAGAAA